MTTDVYGIRNLTVDRSPYGDVASFGFLLGCHFTFSAQTPFGISLTRPFPTSFSPVRSLVDQCQGCALQAIDWLNFMIGIPNRKSGLVR